MSEREKMIAGELYDPMDSELVTARTRARNLCQLLNASAEADADTRRRIVTELFGAGGDTVWMQPPFFCDYGANIELGERVFFNFNCIVLDVCPVCIGSFTLFGPSVQILTPMHPWNAAERRKTEFGKPIEIGAGRLGRRRRHHPAGRADRGAGCGRRRQRGVAGHSRWYVRCRQSLPRGAGNHGGGGGTETKFRLTRYGLTDHRGTS